MNQPKDITIEDLEKIMREALEKDGWNQDEIEGYVRAQKRSGWLRRNCPAWIRNSAAVHYLLPPADGF